MESSQHKSKSNTPSPKDEKGNKKPLDDTQKQTSSGGNQKSKDEPTKQKSPEFEKDLPAKKEASVEKDEKKAPPQAISSVKEKSSTPATDADQDVMVDEDEELLVENDGDVFWLLQRAVWMIVKVVLGLAVIGFVVWIIWGGSDSDNSSRVLPHFFSRESQEDSPETTPTPTENQDLPSSEVDTADDEGFRIPFVGSSEEDSDTDDAPSASVGITAQDDIDRYLRWVTRSRVLFQTRLQTEQWGTDTTVRAQKMDQLLTDIRNLVVESARLRSELVSKIQAYSDGLNQSNEMVAYHTRLLNESLRTIRPEESALHLHQQAYYQMQSQKNYAFYNANRYVLQVMEVYDQSLRSVYYKALANKSAIVQNIQVVYFDRDPFGRVLTPAQWEQRKQQ